MQFPKDVSGNPAGRPKEIKDKRHRYAESVYQRALAGDMTAARMLLDRTLPNKRPEQDRVQISHSGNIALDAQNVLRSVFDSEVSQDVGASLLGSITSVLKAIEVEDLAKRIQALEEVKQ